MVDGVTRFVSILRLYQFLLTLLLFNNQKHTRAQIPSTTISPRKSNLQLRIPSRPICTLKRLLPPIPKDRTELEPLLPTTNTMHAPLMAEVDILANGQALAVLVAEDCAARGFGLADYVRRARVVEEAVVDAAAVPGIYALGAPEGRVAYERVSASVVG